MSSTTTKKKVAPKEPTMEAQAEELRRQWQDAERTAEALAGVADESAARVSEIESAWARGDDNFAATDLIHAAGEATRAKALAASAARRAAQLAAEQINTDVRVADLLATAAEAVYQGLVPVDVALGKAPFAASELPAIPHIRLTQERPSEEEGGVLASKKVMLSFGRSGMFGPFLLDEFERKAKSLGYDIHIDDFRKGDTTVRADDIPVLDHVRIKAYRVTDSEPIFSDEDAPGDEARKWADNICRQLVMATARQDRPMVVMGEKADNSEGRVRDSSAVVTSKDGRRITTVRAEILVHPFAKDSQPGPLLRAVIDGQVNTTVPWLGRCIEIGSEIELASKNDYATWKAPRLVRVEAKFASRSN